MIYATRCWRCTGCSGTSASVHAQVSESSDFRSASMSPRTLRPCRKPSFGPLRLFAWELEEACRFSNCWDGEACADRLLPAQEAPRGSWSFLLQKGSAHQKSVSGGIHANRRRLPPSGGEDAHSTHANNGRCRGCEGIRARSQSAYYSCGEGCRQRCRGIKKQRNF